MIMKIFRILDNNDFENLIFSNNVTKTTFIKDRRCSMYSQFLKLEVPTHAQ